MVGSPQQLAFLFLLAILKLVMDAGDQAVPSGRNSVFLNPPFGVLRECERLIECDDGVRFD